MSGDCHCSSAAANRSMSCPKTSCSITKTPPHHTPPPSCRVGFSKLDTIDEIKILEHSVRYYPRHKQDTFTHHKVPCDSITSNNWTLLHTTMSYLPVLAIRCTHNLTSHSSSINSQTSRLIKKSSVFNFPIDFTITCLCLKRLHAHNSTPVQRKY